MSSAPLGPEPEPVPSQKVVAIEAARNRRSGRARSAVPSGNPDLHEAVPIAGADRPATTSGRLADARAAASASVFRGRDDVRASLVQSLKTAVASCRALLHWDEDLFADVSGWERDLLTLEMTVTRSFRPGCGPGGTAPALDRAAFEEHLRAAVRAGRSPVSVLAIDVDRLGFLNAQHGREAGDRTLTALAGRIRTCLGAGDVLAVGLDGADYAVAALGCGLLPAVVLGERVRIAAEAGGSDGLPDVTVSIGIATLRDREELGPFALRVGSALQAAKRAGRNRVEAHAGG